MPFVWEPGGPLPPAQGPLHFEPAPAPWLAPALAEVMASSIDESDHAAVAEPGAAGAAGAAGVADERLAVPTDCFAPCRGGWRIFCDTSARNAPMLAAFRHRGYQERAAWERPLR